MWKCKCGIINNGLNQKCAASLTWKEIEHYMVSSNSPDWLMFIVAMRWINSKEIE